MDDRALNHHYDKHTTTLSLSQHSPATPRGLKVSKRTRRLRRRLQLLSRMEDPAREHRAPERLFSCHQLPPKQSKPLSSALLRPPSQVLLGSHPSRRPATAAARRPTRLRSCSGSARSHDALPDAGPVGCWPGADTAAARAWKDEDQGLEGGLGGLEGWGSVLEFLLVEGIGATGLRLSVRGGASYSHDAF